MPDVYAAMKGRMGSTDYFILPMKAMDLVGKTTTFPNLMERDNPTLEMRALRESVDNEYIKRHIAPYLAGDKDRFFGAIIVTARNFNPDNFEPIAEVATKGMPNLYKSQAQLMGFLTFDGGEQLMPLDGQHRLKALKFAIEGYDEKAKKIEGMSPNSELATDDITVILIPHDSKKSRKIFTKVNRYAKPTTTGQNLVIDDDDIIAVLSRDIANNQDIIGPDLVKYATPALNDKDGHFTTLAALNKCNHAILEDKFGKIDRASLPDRDKARLYEETVTEVWTHLVRHVSLFADMLADKSDAGNDRRRELRADYLLGKPVPQACLVRAFAYMTTRPGGDKFTYKKATDLLNEVDWRKDAPLWDRLLMGGKQINHKQEGIATDILCHMAGCPRDSEAKLLERYKALFPLDERNGKTLPAKLA